MNHSTTVRRDRNPIGARPKLYAYAFFAYPDPEVRPEDGVMFGAGYATARDAQEAEQIGLDHAYEDLAEEDGFWGHECLVHVIPLETISAIVQIWEGVPEPVVKRQTEQPMRAPARVVKQPTRRGGYVR